MMPQPISLSTGTGRLLGRVNAGGEQKHFTATVCIPGL